MKFLLCLAALVVLAVAEDFECKPDIPYKENDCNTCFCTPTKLLGCTLKFCPEVDNQKLHNCDVGTTFKKDCNQCWCVKDQGTICENNDC